MRWDICEPETLPGIQEGLTVKVFSRAIEIKAELGEGPTSNPSKFSAHHWYIVGSASSQNPEYSAFCRFKAEKHLQNKLCASVGKMKAEGASLVSWQKPILAVLFFKLVAFSYSFGFHFCWFFFAWKAWILEQFLVVQKNASQPGRKQLPSYFWLLYLRH